MKRTHALLIALALGIAVVAGTFAALRSQQLAGNAVPHVSSNQYAAQTRALDRAEAAIKAELRRRPPAVPAVSVAGPAQTPQAVIYRRPAPIVHIVHRHEGEHEAESHDGDGFDD